MLNLPFSKKSTSQFTLWFGYSHWLTWWFHACPHLNLELHFYVSIWWQTTFTANTKELLLITNHALVLFPFPLLLAVWLSNIAKKKKKTLHCSLVFHFCSHIDVESRRYLHGNWFTSACFLWSNSRWCAQNIRESNRITLEMFIPASWKRSCS